MGMIARCIMGFAGHMIDDPQRPVPRFPPAAEPMVRSAIRECLERYQPEIALSSAACGGDIIFAEEAIELKIPIYIILPFEDIGEFITQSVSFPKDGKRWVKRFYNVLKGAKQIFYVNPGTYDSPKDFEETQHAIIFFSLGLQETLKIQIVNIILYDDLDPTSKKTGGTNSFLELCEQLKKLNLERLEDFFVINEKIDMGKIRRQMDDQDN